MAKHILSPKHDQVLVAAVDLSAASASVFDAAVEIAHASPHATIHLVHVTGGKRSAAGDPAAALTRFAERLPDAGANIELHAIDAAHPADAIVKFAAQVSADMILIGTHGRTGLARMFVGSVAEKVARTAGCAVLIVRPKALPR